MAALTQDRNTLNKELGRSILVPVAAATQVFAGGLAARSATGFAVPAADTAGLVVIGVFEEQVDNSAGADGDLSVIVRKGVFGFTTLGTVIDQADMGNEVFVSDDNNLEKVAGVVNNIRAGTLDAIDGLQFYIKIDEHAV